MSLLEGVGALLSLVRVWLATLSPWEVGGALISLLSVWLTTLENIWCWPTGVVGVGLYVVVFGQAKLYADMGLQVIYVALCLYGWYEWLHGGKDHGVLRVSRTPARAILPLGAAGIAFAFLLGEVLYRETDAALPFWDSATTSFSLVAQWMQTRKWLETWVVWIAVDVVYVGMYVYKRLHPTAALYAVFLVLAVLGLRAWSSSLPAEG